MDHGFCVIEMIFDENGVAVDYRFLEYNSAFEKQAGLQNAIGRRMRDLVPSHEQHWFDMYGNVARTGERLRTESRASGLGRWFELYAFRVGGSASVKVAVVFTDITERKRADERTDFLANLSRSLARATTETEIVETTTEAVGTHLAADRCYFVECREKEDRIVVSRNWIGDRSRSLEGNFSLLEFGGMEWWRLYSLGNFAVEDIRTHPFTRAKVQVYEAVGVRSYAVQPFRQEGEWTVILAVTKATPRNWATSELALMDDVVARVWPLVERARIDQALRENQAVLRTTAERFRLLSENVAVHVWTATREGQLDYANQECVDYFGVAAAGDLLGDRWTKFVHPEDLPNLLQRWKESLETGQPYDVEFRLRRVDDSDRWFLTRAEAMRDDHGEITRWFGTNTDIHELRTARTAAENASRAKDDFLAALSHELRTPLTPVLIAATSLAEDDRLPSEVREQLRMMERNIGLEARLIDDLLDLTKITHGKLKLLTQPCDPHVLIELACEIVREEANAKRISIVRQFDASQTRVLVDPARFQQVIWNLLRNAVKFTQPDGTIAIVTRREENMGNPTLLLIEVADTGIGIEPEKLESIFSPFEQGGPLREHRFGGLGLGLAIARAVVEMHGGKIGARSAGANLGSTFAVQLPEAPATAVKRETVVAATAASKPSPVSLKGSQTSGLRLLLVEDHPSTLQTLGRLLQRDGHRVTTASNVEEGLARAAEDSFDLVVSDLGLPDGTGNDLMEKLRATYGLRGIALSGYGMEDDLMRSRNSGFLAHLVKPIQMAQLRQALAASQEV